MKYSLSKIAIVTVGLLTQVAGGVCIWEIYTDPSAIEHSPTGYLFNLFLGPPLLILGVCVALRYYWAGIILEIICGLAVFDWLMSRRPKDRGDDITIFFIFILLLVLLTAGRNQWKKLGYIGR